jgi:hypothetical protein
MGGNARVPCGRECFEGPIPGALPARNKAGKASQGVNRREGSQTLRPERSEPGTARASGPATLHVLKGAEVQERCWLAAADRLGQAVRDSERRRNSARGCGSGN